MEKSQKKISSCNFVQYWDEFETLAKSFGLYKSGGASFDRTIYLTLYNGESNMIHSTKTNNYRFLNPR